MSDFLSFLHQSDASDKNIDQTVERKNENFESDPRNDARNIYDRYAGKSADELNAELEREIERRKNSGGIPSSEIEAYYSVLAPYFNEEQKKRLDELMKKLK